MFDVFELPHAPGDLTEALGSKFKFWFDHPRFGRCLFKQCRRPNEGEDWAEKVAAELCELIKLPHACYELATWRGSPGVISPTFVPIGGRLVLGDELISSFVADYPTESTTQKRRRRTVKQHTLRTVIILLASPVVQLPIGHEPLGGLNNAADVFIGYLMLDAWIGNQDRHHQNWALIRQPTHEIYLAPTFDHASSLGRNEPDAKRRKRLFAGQDQFTSIESYVTRAVSQLFESRTSSKPLTTFDAFRHGARERPIAGLYWLNRLRNVSQEQVVEILDQIPQNRISHMGIAFAQRLLDLNRDRLLTLVSDR